MNRLGIAFTDRSFIDSEQVTNVIVKELVLPIGKDWETVKVVTRLNVSLLFRLRVAKREKALRVTVE